MSLTRSSCEPCSFVVICKYVSHKNLRMCSINYKQDSSFHAIGNILKNGFANVMFYIKYVTIF